MFTVRAYNWATKAYALHQVADLSAARKLGYGLSHQTKVLGRGRRATRANPTVEILISRGKTDLARYIGGHAVTTVEEIAAARQAMPLAQLAAVRKPGPVAEAAEPVEAPVAKPAKRRARKPSQVTEAAEPVAA